jgi:hypothetical protein
VLRHVEIGRIRGYEYTTVEQDVTAMRFPFSFVVTERAAVCFPSRDPRAPLAAASPAPPASSFSLWLQRPWLSRPSLAPKLLRGFTLALPVSPAAQLSEPRRRAAPLCTAPTSVARSSSSTSVVARGWPPPCCSCS